MATQFASPVNLNFFGYRIVDNVAQHTAKNVTVGFKYKGYEIAFSSFNPAGSKVMVLANKALVDEFDTVEAAIVGVDELLNWRTGRQLDRRGNWRSDR